jgi:hypothetical protein
VVSPFVQSSASYESDAPPSNFASGQLPFSLLEQENLELRAQNAELLRKNVILETQYTTLRYLQCISLITVWSISNVTF